MTLDLATLHYAAQRAANHAIAISSADDVDQLSELMQLSELETERRITAQRTIRRMLSTDRNERKGR
jgi:hypothetical protein